MWREMGLSVEPRESSIGWPRVSASFDFRRPLRFEDAIEVRLRVIGKTAKTLDLSGGHHAGGRDRGRRAAHEHLRAQTAGRADQGDGYPGGDREPFEVVAACLTTAGSDPLIAAEPVYGRGPAGSVSSLIRSSVSASPGRDDSFHAGIGGLPGG